MQHEPLDRLRHAGEQAGDLVAAEHRRQGFGLLAVGDHGDSERGLQRQAVEQPQGANGLVEDTPGGLLFEQVELIVANVLGAESIRGTVEVPGEARDVVEVGLLGAGAVVTQAQVVEKALSQGIHGSLRVARASVHAGPTSNSVAGPRQARKCNLYKRSAGEEVKAQAKTNQPLQKRDREMC